MNDDTERLLPSHISDESAAVLCGFLAELTLAAENRYCHQLRRYRETRRQPVNPLQPWKNLHSD